MKIFIRTLWGNSHYPLWFNDDTRDSLRQDLNKMGFYVLTGSGDSLDVYVVDDDTPIDMKIWYILTRGRK